MSTVRIIAALPEKMVKEAGGTPHKKLCAVCGEECWIGGSQQELIDEFGEETFLIACDACLIFMAGTASEATVLASEDVMRELKAKRS